MPRDAQRESLKAASRCGLCLVEQSQFIGDSQFQPGLAHAIQSSLARGFPCRSIALAHRRTDSAGDPAGSLAASGSENSDTSVIMLYQHGGASQLETYDLKPDASSSYRSVFNPIPTNVPGMDICRAISPAGETGGPILNVDSLHHDVGIHSDGGIVALTGKRPTVLDPTSQSRQAPPISVPVASAALQGNRFQGDAALRRDSSQILHDATGLPRPASLCL